MALTTQPLNPEYTDALSAWPRCQRCGTRCPLVGVYPHDALGGRVVEVFECPRCCHQTSAEREAIPDADELAHIERAIAHARSRVERWQALVKRMKLRGRDTRAAEIQADLLAQSLNALLTYRRLARQGMRADA